MISYNTIGQDRMIMDDVLIDTDLTKYINNLRKYVGLVELPFGTDSYEISDYLNRNDLYNLKDMKEKTVKKLDLDRENVLHNVTIFQEYRSIFEFDIRTFYEMIKDQPKLFKEYDVFTEMGVKTYFHKNDGKVMAVTLITISKK
jgi:hypothetical protein